MFRSVLLTLYPIWLVIGGVVRHYLLVPRSGRRGRGCRSDRLGAIEGIESRMRMMNPIHTGVGRFLGEWRWRRIRGRSCMYCGSHSAVQWIAVLTRNEAVNGGSESASRTSDQHDVNSLYMHLERVMATWRRTRLEDPVRPLSDVLQSNLVISVILLDVSRERGSIFASFQSAARAAMLRIGQSTKYQENNPILPTPV